MYEESFGEINSEEQLDEWRDVGGKDGKLSWESCLGDCVKGKKVWTKVVKKRNGKKKTHSRAIKEKRGMKERGREDSGSFSLGTSSY